MEAKRIVQIEEPGNPRPRKLHVRRPEEMSEVAQKQTARARGMGRSQLPRCENDGREVRIGIAVASHSIQMARTFVRHLLQKGREGNGTPWRMRCR